MAGDSMARHLVDVVAILVLGMVYVVLLSVGTLLKAGREKVESLWSAGSAAGRRIRPSARSGQ